MSSVVKWNGTTQSFGHIAILMLGGMVEEVSGIKYDQKQEKTNNYGAGNKAVSRGHGKIECEASITLSLNEVQKLRAKLPAGMSLIQIPAFDITVSFVSDAYKPITHRLIGCEFTDEGVESKSGDTKTEREYKLIVGDIIFN